MPATALALADPPQAPESASASTTVVPLPKKRGPNTPEGKARSRQNALKHGLRAKLLPLPLTGDDATHFQELLSGLRRTYRPEDAAEAGLVEAIAAAMWQEITADRLGAEALAAMAGGGRPFHGGTLLESPANRATLHTVLRYQATASCAVGRAMRLFFRHRRAKRDGLLVPDEATWDCTNDLPPPPEAVVANDDVPAPEPAAATPAAAEPALARPEGTNEPTGFRHNMPPLDPRDLLPTAEPSLPRPKAAPPAPPTGVPPKRTNVLLGSASPAALAPRFGSPASWNTTR